MLPTRFFSNHKLYSYVYIHMCKTLRYNVRMHTNFEDIINPASLLFHFQGLPIHQNFADFLYHAWMHMWHASRYHALLCFIHLWPPEQKPAQLAPLILVIQRFILQKASGSFELTELIVCTLHPLHTMQAMKSQGWTYVDNQLTTKTMHEKYIPNCP